MGLLLASYDVVFQEVPGETTLALNLAGCPNGCPGCHSPYLQLGVGEELTDELLCGLLERYGGAVTCVGFMGGDADPAEVCRLAGLVRSFSSTSVCCDMSVCAGGGVSGGGGVGGLKTAWYSGRAEVPDGVCVGCFDYIKLGPYVESLGGLSSADTNQRFYRVVGGELVDATSLFA